MLNVNLRAWKLTDLNDLVAIANNNNIAKNMMNIFPHPYTPEHGKGFIAATQTDPLRIFAIVIEGKVAGSIGLHPQTDIQYKNAEVGYWLAEPYWGKGVITKVLGEMLEYGFQNLGVNRIFARAFGSNIASQKALEKAGFILEARFEKTFFKNGEYEDEWVYAVRKHDFKQEN